MTPAKPFLKWAGGKRQLLRQFEPLFPRAGSWRRHVEPFVGAGAVFFHLAPRKALLSDANAELVETYQTLRDEPRAVIDLLKHKRNTAEDFYRERALEPARLERVERAARTIYLNRTCYNGLYRVNKAGRFNVPFGRYARPVLCDEQNLLAVSRALASAELRVAGFEAVLDVARRGDFVYLDPPYHPLSATSSFVSYTSGRFGPEDQRRLASVYRELHERGCLVMLSNSDTAFVRSLYETFDVRTVSAGRAINSKGDARGPVSELVVINYDPAER